MLIHVLKELKEVFLSFTIYNLLKQKQQTHVKFSLHPITHSKAIKADVKSVLNNGKRNYAEPQTM